MFTIISETEIIFSISWNTLIANDLNLFVWSRIRYREASKFVNRMFALIWRDREEYASHFVKMKVYINPFPNKPLFLRGCSTSLLKTLIRSNFSFSHSVFYLFGEFSAIFLQSEIVVCKLFQFRKVWILWFGKGLIWRKKKRHYVRDRMTF